MEQSHTSPLEVFSTEEWQLILENIEDPNDLWNVAHADHSFFRELLKTKGDAMITTLLPMLYTYLKEKDLLVWRQVSKRLKTTMDTYLEDGQRWRNADELGDHKLDLCLDVNRLTKRMEFLPQGKIPGGCVYADGHRRFFQHFGDKVFHLRLNVWMRYPVPFLKYLRNVLENTPNLKTLKLSSACEGSAYDVVKYLEQNPLPELPNLVSLTIYASMYATVDDSGNEKVHQAILRKYESKLEHLSVSQGKNVDFCLRQSMPKLTTLYLETCQLRTLNSLRFLQAPFLQKIELMLEFADFEIDNAFKILETFQATLKKLSFRSEGSKFEISSALMGNNDQFPNRVDLPHLEELRLTCFYPSNDTKFDFLLGLKKLRWLKLGVYSKRDDNGNAMGDMAGVTQHLNQNGELEDSFYTSPVWKALPKLDKVIMCKYKTDYQELEVKTIHTRNGYEDYQNLTKGEEKR